MSCEIYDLLFLKNEQILFQNKLRKNVCYTEILFLLDSLLWCRKYLEKLVQAVNFSLKSLDLFNN